jgi:Asp/Glu/hydantoin racemase
VNRIGCVGFKWSEVREGGRMTEKATNTRLMLSEPVFGESPRQHWEWLTKMLDAVGNPGTSVDFVNLKHGYKVMRTYTRTYNSLGIVQRAYEAEKKGYDGFIIGCASDLGLKEARSMVSIPVIGSTEATTLLACTLGNKFSVITTDPTACGRTENLVKSYGLADRLASVRCPPGLTSHKNFAMMAEGREQQKRIVDMLTAAMVKAINEDGAEVVYVSCLPTSGMLAMHHVYEVEGAPVVNMFTAALKQAESMVALKRAYGTVVCKRSIFLGPHTGWEQEIPIPID